MRLVAVGDGDHGASIALGVQDCHGGFGEVAAFVGGPFVVGVGDYGADEADDGGLAGEDADDSGSALDLLVESF